jgi:hypothetical protein
MKILNIIAKIIFSLLLFLTAISALGIMPAPTRDLYNTDNAFMFITILMGSKYVTILNGIIAAASLYLLWTKRVPLAALLMLPITINIVGFHTFLDGGLFTGGAVMGNIFLLLNGYFLWQSKTHYAQLFNKK